MAGLNVDRATKRFGEHAAVDGVTLTVADGELVALLGPSGCGKSTLLRLVAGFERLDAGRIRIGGEVVSDAEAGAHVPTERRQLGMVFQSYALWPHMSVAGNVAFALEVARVPEAERRDRVGRALETVGLGALARHRPAELSGGQRQRVALARTLAARPRVVLLDEPLANLDANLREAMQDEFRRFHAEIGATMIFVTHDQAEALALADRVAVMMSGGLRQMAPPREVYDRPADADVARFIGRGSVVPLRCLEVRDGRALCEVAGRRLTMRAGPGVAPGPAEASLRPDDCRAVPPSASDPGALPGRVLTARFTGPAVLLGVVLADGRGTEILARAGRDEAPSPGAEVAVEVADGWVLAPAACL